MQEVMDRPQLGGVISRMVARTRCLALSESTTPTFESVPSPQRKQKPRKWTSSGRRIALFSSLI